MIRDNRTKIKRQATQALEKPHPARSRFVCSATADGRQDTRETHATELNGIMEPEMLRWFEVGLRRMSQAELEKMLHGYSLFSRDPGTVAAIRGELERRKRRKRGR